MPNLLGSVYFSDSFWDKGSHKKCAFVRKQRHILVALWSKYEKKNSLTKRMGCQKRRLKFTHTLLRPRTPTWRTLGIISRGWLELVFCIWRGLSGISYLLPLRFRLIRSLSKRRSSCSTFASKLLTSLYASRLLVIPLHIPCNAHLHRPKVLNSTCTPASTAPTQFECTDELL